MTPNASRATDPGGSGPTGFAGWVMCIPAVGLLAVPLLGLLSRVRWSTFVDDLARPESLSAIRLSLFTSTAAIALTVVVGLPLAWRLSQAASLWATLVRGLVLLPLVVPPVVGGVALSSAFSLRGLVGAPLYRWTGLQLTFSPAGVVLAEAFVAMPFFVVTVEAGLRGRRRTPEDAARTLGAARLDVLRRVTFPSIRASLAAGIALSWARALGEFGATITFAGNVAGRTRTVPLEVALLAERDPRAANSLSLSLVAFSLVVVVALRGHWFAPRPADRPVDRPAAGRARQPRRGIEDARE